ncbi:MAG: LysM peptidoglycan-binding domain-containing M23 family metallopeptidase [Pseudomonadota bacterium]
MRIILTLLFIVLLVTPQVACVRRGGNWPVGEPLSRDSVSTSGFKRCYHVVNKDETLSGIAMRYHVNVLDLARENQLESPFVIKEGSSLVLPINTVDSSVQTTPGQEKKEDDNETLDSQLSLPLATKITQKFGEGDQVHRNGISFDGYEGAEVKAAESGIVGHVGEIPGLGRVALIEHENHLVSVYAHLNYIKVSTGDKVTRNQIIGSLGGSGNGTNSTLYFEVRSRAKAVNPTNFFKTKKQ